MSLTLPLAVGYLAEREILEITLRESRDPSGVGQALREALPPGLEVVSVEETDAQRRHVASRLVAAVYRIELGQEVFDLAERVDALLARDRVEIEEARDERTRRRDIRPFLLELCAVNASTLGLRTALREGAGARPEHVVVELGIPLDGVLIIRERIEVGP
jgi:radical SAM-linked protein